MTGSSPAGDAGSKDRRPWDPPTNSLPEGWYPDPLDHQLHRFFNGQKWTHWTVVPARHEAQLASTESDVAGTAPTRTELRDDIATAKRAATALIGSGREIKKLEQCLYAEERVLALAGAQRTGTGVLACTNRRLLYLYVSSFRTEFLEVDWNRTKNVVYNQLTKTFAVYTGKVTRRAVPALSVQVPFPDDARRVARAAERAASAPRLDVI